MSCIICTLPASIRAVTPCKHETCHVCSFRARALYQKNQCLVCRTDNDRVVYTDSGSLKVVVSDDKYGIGFTSQDAKTKTLELLLNKCPKCSEVFQTFKQLNEHVHSQHDRSFCPVCANHRRAFISELRLYTSRQLHQHQARGDQDGFKGHPMCKFCTGKRFYSDDELYVHMRDKHEKCHICDQIDATNPQYFRNYDHLATHFQDCHYVCHVQSCLDQKFVVFRDEFDLRAHTIKEHGAILGGDRKLPAFGGKLTVEEKKEEPKDTYQTKKLRLDERARHYLSYKQDKVDEFQRLVGEFSKSGKENAVLAQLQTLFAHTSPEDLGLLLLELKELFPKKSTQYRFLESRLETQNRAKLLDEQFPALSNVRPLAPAGQWGQSLSGVRRPPTTPKAAPVVNRGTSSNVRLTYLNGGQRQASPSPQNSSQKKSTTPPLNEQLFPGLPTVQKPKPPRVNPVNTSLGQWNQGLNQSSSPEPVLEVKKGKKGKQVLFRMGVNRN
ncbi:hypothetical protein OGAPHI_006098 [Ogataea philodendri]|uniref:RING-type domain-containing protein n=1 Tax=Ogataea philodendri TaxID=1378263 RepID=A0A9P8NZI3_9ASCO|nr:uncharacterized protein OGAPHI_006098 [Ogataea philodendri]KAH3661919.1 hypothetical protein OGAPHI_006098 [Ogataea philodendri]